MTRFAVMAARRANPSRAPFENLRGFIGQSQALALVNVLAGEEGEGMKEVLANVAKRIADMPLPRETEGQGEKAVVYLHYFTGGQDWYITEKDSTQTQQQAFGLADFGDGGELGYISIAELIANNVELDLYWEPKPLSEVRAKRTSMGILAEDIHPTKIAQYAAEAGPKAADRPPYDSSPNGLAFMAGLWAREKKIAVHKVHLSRGYTVILNDEYKLDFKNGASPPVVTPYEKKRR